MGFTYTAGGTTDLDRVRLEIQDIFEDRALFQDEEINDFLAQDVSVLGAAAHAAETLAMRFARDFDFTADGASFKKNTLSEKYERLAQRLRKRATGVTTVNTTRIDGFSDDISSDETNLTTERSGRIGDDF